MLHPGNSSSYRSAARAELLAHVSALYYLDGHTQDDIARRLHLSRTNVGRLLRKARDAGIARILVRPPAGQLVALESELEERYGLREVRAVPLDVGESTDAARRRLGLAAAADFLRTVRPGHVVGVAGADLLASMIDALVPARGCGARVVQAVGWAQAAAAEQPLTMLVRELARRIGGTAVLLSAPASVASESARRTLEADDLFGDALRDLDVLDALYVEIGAAGERAATAASGGDDRVPAGHIASRHFDYEGRMLDDATDGHVVGISVRQLQRVPHVVALARDPANARVIAAALRTQLIHGLITDELTARALASLPPRERSDP